MKLFTVDFGSLIVEAEDEDDAAAKAKYMIADDIDWLTVDIVTEQED